MGQCLAAAFMLFCSLSSECDISSTQSRRHLGKWPPLKCPIALSACAAAVFCLSGPPGQRPRNMMSSTNASAFCYLAAMSRNVASACAGSVWKFSECYCTYNLRSLVLARRSADNACSCCLKTSPSVDGSCGLATECITSTLLATKHNVSFNEKTHNFSFSA